MCGFICMGHHCRGGEGIPSCEVVFKIISAHTKVFPELKGWIFCFECQDSLKNIKHELSWAELGSVI